MFNSFMEGLNPLHYPQFPAVNAARVHKHTHIPITSYSGVSPVLAPLFLRSSVLTSFFFSRVWPSPLEGCGAGEQMDAERGISTFKSEETC